MVAKELMGDSNGGTKMQRIVSIDREREGGGLLFFDSEKCELTAQSVFGGENSCPRARAYLFIAEGKVQRRETRQRLIAFVSRRKTSPPSLCRPRSLNLGF